MLKKNPIGKNNCSFDNKNIKLCNVAETSKRRTNFPAFKTRKFLTRHLNFLKDNKSPNII
ncbi:hypothetical protein BpHYR1_050556 [Brachionus plicatilis]|uniref:Uncharacterized protein n=1 Tax=Brachionus plicatilis TaxID=10195 RepID=A0A3M7PVL8_BRAPC|nr:hypothetical protein BpHYR1_050556 [Brachionus plicatilis]